MSCLPALRLVFPCNFCGVAWNMCQRTVFKAVLNLLFISEVVYECLLSSLKSAFTSTWGLKIGTRKIPSARIPVLLHIFMTKVCLKLLSPYIYIFLRFCWTFEVKVKICTVATLKMSTVYLFLSSRWVILLWTTSDPFQKETPHSLCDLEYFCKLLLKMYIAFLCVSCCQNSLCVVGVSWTSITFGLYQISFFWFSTGIVNTTLWHKDHLS